MRYTLIRATFPKVITKQYELESDGSLGKTVSGNLARGQATLETASDMTEFAQTLAGLRPCEALIYGVPQGGVEEAGILTKAAFSMLTEEGRTGKITRSSDHFAWPEGPGILMLDVDAPKDQPPLPPADAMALLEKVFPLLVGVPHVIVPSASSHIYDTATDKDMTGLRGYHIYVPVDDATAIPQVAKAIEAHLWAAGHGRYDISANGALLRRTLIDMAVHTPCHLDFASGAVTGPGLEQRRGQPIIKNATGPSLRTGEVSIPTKIAAAAEAAEALARAKIAPKAAQIEDVWCTDRAREMTGRGVQPATAARVVKRALGGALTGDFLLRVVDPQSQGIVEVTVTDVLANPVAYDGRETLDPVEPGYDGSRATGMLLLSAKAPHLKSFAHGETDYLLLATVDAIPDEDRDILIREGGTSAAVDATLNVMRVTGTYYDKGDHLVRMGGREEVVMGQDALAYDLGQLLRFKKEARYKKDIVVHDTDPTPALLRQIIGHPDRGLPKLVAQVDHPVPRLDGSIIRHAGHDVSSGLYITRGIDAFPGYVDRPDPGQVVPPGDRIRPALLPARVPARWSHGADQEVGRSGAGWTRVGALQGLHRVPRHRGACIVCPSQHPMPFGPWVSHFNLEAKGSRAPEMPKINAEIGFDEYPRLTAPPDPGVSVRSPETRLCAHRNTWAVRFGGIGAVNTAGAASRPRCIA